MMRPLLLTAGSRGDVEPLLALTDALCSASDVEHTVLMVQRDYESLVPESSKVRAVALPFALSHFMPWFAHAASNAKPDALPFETQWRALGHAICNIVIPTFPVVLETAIETQCNVVLSTTLTWPLASILADKMRIPLALLTLQPDLMSACVPHVNLRPDEAAAAMCALQRGETPVESDDNVATYTMLHDAALPNYLPALNEVRKNHGLPPFSTDGAAALLDGHGDAHTLVAVSTQLAPRPPDMAPKAVVIGALAAGYMPATVVHEELRAFLDSGDAPVVASFGSIQIESGAMFLTRAVLQGLRDADVTRVVLLPGNAGLDTNALDAVEDAELLKWARDDHVITVRDRVQYAWLLPQAAALLCHGGAGAVHAALRAGTPLIIAPVMFDQPFYAAIVDRLCIGAALDGFLPDVTSQRITKAVKTAMSNKVRANMSAFSKKEKEEDALNRVITIFRSMVRTHCVTMG